MFKIFAALGASVAAGLLSGCGEPSSRAAVDPPPKPASAAGETPASETIDPALANRDDGPLSADAFASVDEALGAMREAADGGEGNKAIRIARWLSQQGAAAQRPLEALLEDGSASPTSRIAAIESLIRIGPAALPALIRAAEAEGAMAVRASAIGAAASIKPVSGATLDQVIAWLDLPEVSLRRAAIDAIRRIGPPAGKCAPRLQSILNNVAEDEGLRGEAKRALKSVNPRKTLLD